MDIRQIPFDKWAALISQAYITSRALLFDKLDYLKSLHKTAPDDFATRPEIPQPEDYAAASNAQILDRLYRNPCGLLNEQPYLDTLMSARAAEYQRKQTRSLMLAFYVLTLTALVLLFNRPPALQGQTIEQQQSTETALDNAVGLLREEFNLKLQSRDLEIKDLKRQLTVLSQSQTDLTKQLKSLSKPARPAVNPTPTSKPKKP